MKRRVLIIAHPDFDKPGKEGILAAQQHAEMLQEGNAAMLDDMKNHEHLRDHEDKARAHNGQYVYLVRKVFV